MGNPVVWFEVNGPDADGTAKFYCELFGWLPQPIPEMSYTTVDTQAGGINGGFGQAQEGQPPSVTFYVEANDLQPVLDRAEALGGKTVVPVTEIPDVVTFALLADPQGNVVGLSKRGQDEGGPSAGDNPPVAWFEVLCADPRKAWDFYSELFDWHVKESSAEGLVYGEVDTHAGRGIAGGIGASPDGQPHVNVYVRVDDLQKYLERAESLGGKTIVPPMKVSDNTRIAQFQDPQGTTFGLYTETE